MSDLDDSGGLAVLAEQTRDSPLSDPDYDDAHALAVALAGLEASWDAAEWMPGVDALEAEERRQAAAPGTIAAQSRGHAARPRDRAVGCRAGGARCTGARRRAAAPRHEARPSRRSRLASPERRSPSAGSRRRPTRRWPTRSRRPSTLAPPHPDIGEYVRCLGNLLGADIHLCTEFGLNVHGKGFYLVPFDIKDVRLISGRNVHQRLVQFVGERHRAWAGRQQTGGGALSLTLDGAPVAVAADGAFAVTTPLPPGGTARLALATAAGDVTTIPVP